MRLSFRIALRFLFTNKGQTLLILLGIAIGISVQIFIGSLIQGLQESLLDATIGSSPHITIRAAEKNTPLDNASEIIKQIKQDGQFSAITEIVSLGAFIEVDGRNEQVVIRGFDFNTADTRYQFQERLQEQSQLPKKDNGLIIGIGLAEEFDLSLSDTLTLITVDGRSISGSIEGIIDLKVAALNNSWILSQLDFSRRLSNYTLDQVSSLELQIEEPFEADLIAESYTSLLNDTKILVEDWKSQNQQLLSGLSGQSTSSLMIQVFVVISVVLAIASVLAISVMQKSRQLGILKAMGINDSMASYIFLSQGFILGAIGALLGILLGLGLLFAFTSFALNPDGTPVVPILINPAFIALSGGIAMLASTLASLIPALKSRKLSPMEVIKNG